MKKNKTDLILAILCVICLLYMIDVIAELFLFNPFDWDSKRIEKFNTCIISICAGICTGSIPYLISRLYEHQQKEKIEKILRAMIQRFYNNQNEVLKVTEQWNWDSINNDCFIVRNGLVRFYNTQTANTTSINQLFYTKPLAEINFAEIELVVETRNLLCSIIDRINSNRYAEYFPDDLYDSLCNLRNTEFYTQVDYVHISLSNGLPISIKKNNRAYSFFKENACLLNKTIKAVYKIA